MRRKDTRVPQTKKWTLHYKKFNRESSSRLWSQEKYLWERAVKQRSEIWLIIVIVPNLLLTGCLPCARHSSVLPVLVPSHNSHAQCRGTVRVLALEALHPRNPLSLGQTRWLSLCWCNCCHPHFTGKHEHVKSVAQNDTASTWQSENFHQGRLHQNLPA